MRPHPHRKLLGCALPLLACLLTVGNLPGGAPDGSAAGIRLEPSKTRVGPLRVHLEVDDLRLAGRELQGDYRIRVPFFPSENDSGTIRLTTVGSLEQLHQDGGALTGDAHSAYGKVHLLSCEIQPDGIVLIDVISDKRTLSFKTRIHRLP